MESGRGGGGARQRGAYWRGFLISLRGKDRGAVVQEGIDFAQDSDEGGGSDYLFISDSEDEISDEGSFLPETEEQAPSMDQPLNAVEEQLVQDIEGQGGDAWKDLGSHAQQLEEEADADVLDPHEQDDGANNRLCDVRDSMLMILVPLYYQNNDGKQYSLVSSCSYHPFGHLEIRIFLLLKILRDNLNGTANRELQR